MSPAVTVRYVPAHLIKKRRTGRVAVLVGLGVLCLAMLAAAASHDPPYLCYPTHGRYVLESTNLTNHSHIVRLDVQARDGRLILSRSFVASAGNDSSLFELRLPDGEYVVNVSVDGDSIYEGAMSVGPCSPGMTVAICPRGASVLMPIV